MKGDCLRSKQKEQMKNRNENSCGIYALTFGDEIIYVGQSKKIESRVRAHFRWEYWLKELEKKRIERGKFTSGEQVAYQRYKFIGQNRDRINWKILEQCESGELDNNERYWINKYKPRFNYEGVKDEYLGQHRNNVIKCDDKDCAWGG